MFFIYFYFLLLSLSFVFAVPVRPKRMVREPYFDAVATNTISNGELIYLIGKSNASFEFKVDN